MDWWMLGAGANGIILVAYLVIAWTILGGLARTGQLVSNKLALATGLIFFTCGIGHGEHLYHLLMPSMGIDPETGEAARLAHDWHLSLWDSVTAGAAIIYLSLRNRLPALVQGSQLFEDLRQRQRQALAINDNVVQGLTVAKLAFETGDPDTGMAALDRTLGAARQIITELLADDPSGIGLGPGALRRTDPARLDLPRE